MKKRIRPIGILLSFCLLFCSCERQSSEISFFSMDTYMVLQAECSRDTLQLAQDAIEAVDLLCSTGRSDSALMTCNRTGESQNAQLCGLITDALFYAKQTNGAFNPALYDAIELWQIGKDGFAVPDSIALQNALQTSDYTAITASKDTVLTNGAKLDLSAIAKGYASQQAVDVLKQNGVKNALLSLGGNIALVGDKNGDGYRIGLQDPRGETGASICVLTVSDCFVVTSGDYQRYSEQNGKRYHHILGKDGYPTDNGLCSVTVITDDGAMADAYSTALFVMGLEEGLDFWRQQKNFEAVFVTTDKQIYITPGLAEKCDLTNGGYTLHETEKS